MRYRLPLLVLCLMGVSLWARAAEPRQEVDLSGPGWKLWRDEGAAWKDDELFAPPVDLSKVPANAPTGGWGALGGSGAVAVSVPGTAEEYLQTTPGPAGDITGVTWWYRDVTVPAASGPRRVLLRFEAARMRAEVYVDHKLVGYDLVGNTPFEVDITDVARPGATVQLAVRITDPGGNFDWHDKGRIRWGAHNVPMSHGFGGITGRVKLDSCDPVYVEDTYVQNTPAVTTVNVIATVGNRTAAAVRRDVAVRVLDRRDPARVVATQVLSNVSIPVGSTTVRAEVAAPDAKTWSPEEPNLYMCDVTLREPGAPGSSDSAALPFGFRWFSPVGIGSDAMFRLNGKRIVLRSAISWGFFPINGIFATPAMAERQVRAAKGFGLNMLNFHRAVGQPIILEKADELGLLYYEEPGTYDSGKDDPFVGALLREKWLRMVKRDRSHPSLVIFNMSNETDASPGRGLEYYLDGMRAAHEIDPSRTITRASGLRSRQGIDAEWSTKIHVRPFDETIYKTGWYDDHHAGGMPVWTQSAYRDPGNFYHLIHDKEEIVFWGEEGALSTPPRLGLIKEELARAPHLGWDGGMYLEWYKEFDDFITAKGLRGSFPTVDSLCKAMGDISMEHQGRRIQLMRINDETDGYVINGWESEILEDHSGVVDCFRNPKGDPGIVARYNRPVYVAVMPREQVVASGGSVAVDFFAVNERDLKGAHTLAVTASDAEGKVFFEKSVGVTLAGGDTYGQLLAEGMAIPVPGSVKGFVTVSARLREGTGGADAADGGDRVFAVDWESQPITGPGAVLSGPDPVRGFLTGRKHADAAEYGDDLPKLDWVVVDAPPGVNVPVPVPAGAFTGLRVTFFNGPDFTQKAVEHADDAIDLSAPEGAPPDAGVNALRNYSVRWEGTVRATATADYRFTLDATGQAGVTVDGRAVSGPVRLTAGEAVPVVVEWRQGTGDARCRLMWQPPATAAPADAVRLLERVKHDGTTLVVLKNAAEWMALLQREWPELGYHGAFTVGKAWSGGVHFVRAHPLFEGLPVDGGMDWPYQAVVRDGPARSGLLIDREELVAGAFHANTPLAKPPAPMRLGTAVGIVRYGKGRIIVSTLDVAGNLGGPAGPADVARKLLCNFLAAVGPR